MPYTFFYHDVNDTFCIRRQFLQLCYNSPNTINDVKEHVGEPNLNRGTSFMNTTNPAIVISICLIAVAVIPLLKRHMKDPYGLFHLSFNRLPSDEPDKPPKTEWLNLGYWKVGCCAL